MLIGKMGERAKQLLREGGSEGVRELGSEGVREHPVQRRIIFD